MPASIRNAFPCPGSRSALRPDIARPHAEGIGIRIRMQRLHAGDNAELSKSWNVGRCGRFNMLDARAAILQMVLLRRVFIAIQSHANAVITDSVCEELQAA